MWASIVGFFMQIAAKVLESYFKKRALDEQSIKDYMAFNEIMHRKGLVSVQLRLNATGQIERIDNLWKKESKENDKNRPKY